MRCPYCGAELEDYASFCSICGKYALPLQNDNLSEGAASPEQAFPASSDADEASIQKTPAKKAQRLYPPEESAPIPNIEPSALSREPVHSDRREKPDTVPRKYRVLLLLLLAALICTACGLIYVVANTANMRAQLRRAQSDEATAVENAAGLESRITDLEGQLEEARAEAKAKAEEITSLTNQIASMESDVNQTTYDKESAQRALEEAQTELKALNTKITDLESRLTDAESDLEAAKTALSEAEAENEALTSENKSLTAANAELTAETEFYDSYVVFVMTTATDKYYHKYDCPNFTKKSFLAYSTKLAESNGYSPCPVCAGTAS